MFFKQFYLGCLAHASYLIGSDGVAAVVDPQRDVDQYIREAEEQGLTIRYVIETHLHADFVSGHRELARRTGAQIVFGVRANAAFEFLAVQDGDEIRLGHVTLRALETPGHTPESVCWLVTDTAAGPRPQKVLTGDTLFIGDVGRPDLAGGRGFTAEEMAGSLYDSIHAKLLTLDDDVEVYPAHGAGSACGRNISKERSSTIGEQRRMNYALRIMDRDEFIRVMTTDLPAAPRYFSMDAELNRQGARELAELPLQPLKPHDVTIRVRCGARILDVRDATSFGNSHIPGSINIGLDGQYASWAAQLLGDSDHLILVAESEERAAEAQMRLARVGLEHVDGYLDGGIAAWAAEDLKLTSLPQIAVDELQARLADEARLQIIDVRNASEYKAGHVPGAVNIPLAQLETHVGAHAAGTPAIVICAGGYRSSMASSILERKGVRELSNVVGGTSAWVAAGFPTEH
jgi:glyoxylase-like metal-dependent hydrolase (beta-lactamase superfamily II)/rhodanese-related sulfurtransferase